MSKYKILSLDGGGSWALIQIRCLQKLFGANTGGQKVLSNFDLVISNSGGSMAMGAMVNNYTLEEIAQIYLDQSKLQLIFQEKPLSGINRTLGFGPKYYAKKKREGLG